MARSQHKHVLRDPWRHRPRLLRIGVAATTALALATPAAAVVWSDGGDAPTPLAGVAGTAAHDRGALESGTAQTEDWSEQAAITENLVPAVRLTARPTPAAKARSRAVGEKGSGFDAGERSTGVDTGRRAVPPATAHPTEPPDVTDTAPQAAEKRGTAAADVPAETRAPVPAREPAPEPTARTAPEPSTQPAASPEPAPSVTAEPEPEPGPEPAPAAPAPTAMPTLTTGPSALPTPTTEPEPELEPELLLEPAPVLDLVLTTEVE